MNAPNFLNRTLFRGENLDFMRGINSECIDLIATDPPFNKGKDFHATPDSLASGAKFQDRWTYKRDVHPAWEDQIRDEIPALAKVIESARKAHSESMGAFMCWMSVRLMEMHRLLKPTGSIYLHCDATASHYIKACMDAIFRHKNFLGDISWNKQNGVKSGKGWGNENDNILCYAKKYGAHTFNSKSKRCRKPYADTRLEMHFTNRDESGRLYRERIINGKEYRYYADEGRFIGNLWDDVPSMIANTPLNKNGESTGFPTQKPLDLYKRIIETSSNKGGMVMDPFYGCATTLVSAEHLNRQWVGIDLWPKSANLVKERMSKESVGGELNKLGYLEIHLAETPPERTDDGLQAAPYLKALWGTSASGKRMSRDLMKEWLIEDLLTFANGRLVCPGCSLIQPRKENFQLDHVEPKSDYGRDTIGNRILLCGPCNKDKSNGKTMSALHKHNLAAGVIKERDMPFLRNLLERMHKKAQKREEEFLRDLDKKETPLLSE